MNYSIDIKLTEQDYTRFVHLAVQRACQSNTESLDENSLKPAVINLVLWCCIAIVLTSIFQYFSGSDWQFDWFSAGLGALPFIALLGVMLYNLKNQQKRCMPKENGTVLSPKKLELSEQGIIERNETTSSFYAWSCVDEMVEKDGEMYIFLDTVVAHIIPASAFQSEEQKQQFKDCVNRYLTDSLN